jgi:hypothetical protein
VFFTFQVITSGHAGLFLIVAIACLALWRLARRESLRLASLPGDLGVVGAMCLVVVALLMVPYVTVRREQSWVRTLEESRIWSPNAASFLESPSHVHRLMRSVLGWQTRGAKAALFPGILPLLLARSPSGHRSVIRVRGHDGAQRIAIVSFWLALGPDYGLYALIYELPASNFIRVPSRYITLTLLALAILAAHGLDWVARRPRSPLAATVAVLLAVEFAVVPLDAVPYDRAIPEADRWLAGRPTPFEIAEVPVISAAPGVGQQPPETCASTAHWQRRCTGYSGSSRPAIRRFTASSCTSTTGLDACVVRVDYVVVHESSTLRRFPRALQLAARAAAEPHLQRQRVARLTLTSPSRQRR